MVLVIIMVEEKWIALYMIIVSYWGFNVILRELGVVNCWGIENIWIEEVINNFVVTYIHDIVIVCEIFIKRWRFLQLLMWSALFVIRNTAIHPFIIHVIVHWSVVNVLIQLGTPTYLRLQHQILREDPILWRLESWANLAKSVSGKVKATTYFRVLLNLFEIWLK